MFVQGGEQACLTLMS